MQDAKKSPYAHHRTTLSGYIFVTKARIDNRKNLSSNMSSICAYNETAEIYWRVWGTPANFNGFRVLAALLHGTLVVGVSQTLRRWTEGATPPIFGRTAITLGIGPQSSFIGLLMLTWLEQNSQKLNFW